MRFYSKLKTLFRRNKLVFENLEEGSKRLVFDVGTLLTFCSYCLLFSSIGASFYFTKSKKIDNFSTEKTISDINNCEVINSIVIANPDSIKIEAGLANPTCLDGDGEIKINIGGGESPYTQTWSNGDSTTNITGLNAGTYTVTVYDNFGFQQIDSFLLNGANVLSANISAVDYNGFEISCYGASDGKIDVTITGGTGPYSYSWSSGQTTEDLNNVIAGTYTVTITDAGGGCTTTRTITLNQPAELGLNLSYISNTDFSGFGVSCFGENDGQIWVAAFGGDGTHSYEWSNGTTGISGIQNLSPGDYTVTVTDGRNCTSTAIYNLTEPPLLTLDTAYLSSEDFNGFGVSCNGASDGQIWVTAAGGDGTHNYAWSDGSTGVSGINGITAGNYTVTLTDGNDCDTIMYFTLTEPGPLSINNTITDVKCNGESTGEIDLEISGGTGIYTFEWNNSETTEDLTLLTAGDYTVTVTDANDCSTIENYTVNEPDVLSSTAIIDSVKCFEGNDGSINQTVIGGRVPFTFAWSNSATTEDISGLAVGIYTVTITDFNNCTFTNSFTVYEPIELTLSESHDDVSCFGEADGNITITPSGGSPSYEYIWSNTSTTSSLTNIIAGDYTVTVTDANDCEKTLTITIGQPNEIIPTAVIDSVKCFGEANGSIALTTIGGTPTYDYSWSNAGSTATISGLTAGTYTVTISDIESCSKVETYTVYEPTELSATLSQTNIKCNGDNSGDLTANPTGGTPPYAYSWSNSIATANNNNLTAGTYTVTVTDKNDCSTTVAATITEPNPLAATHVTAEPLCNGDSDGEITVTPSGGVTPYSYVWNVGGSSNILDNISAGNYTVTITDLENCEFIYNVTVGESDPLAISSTQTEPDCNGASDGTIDLIVIGGVPNYVYNWSDMDNEAMWTMEETTDDVSGNNHHRTLAGTEAYSTDAVGGSYSFDFEQNTKIRYSDGSFMNTSFTQRSISMWIKPDDFTINQTLFEQGSSANGLALRLDNDEIQGVVTRLSNDQRSAKISFPNDGAWHHVALIYDNGDLFLYLDGVEVDEVNTTFTTITSLGNGGLGGTFGSDPFGNTNNRYYDGKMDNVFYHTTALTAEQVADLANNNGDRTGLEQGTYTIQVTDGNGCTESIDITINEPTALALSTVQTNVSCEGGSDGVARVMVSGATAPYTYAWNATETKDSLTGLSIGDYTVTVTDAKGCIDSITVTITEPIVLTASAIGQDVTCNGGTNGAIILTVNDGTPGYTYTWSGGAGTNQNPTGLSAGTYTVTVTDNNQCTVVASAIIGEPDAMVITGEVNDISCTGEVDGELMVSITGGTPNYTYAWSNGGSTTETLSDLGVGTYTVTVTDDKGCTATFEGTITASTPIDIDGTVTNVSCNGGDDGGVIDLNVTGGTPGYTYLWSDMDVEAYYGFELTTDDETGNGHNLQGGVGNLVGSLDASERDYSFSFDGSTKLDYEEDGVFLNGTIETFSLSMWVQPSGFTGNQTLFEMGGVAAGFGIRLSGNLLQVGVNESFILYGIQTPFPNDGAWHHITITFDNGNLVLFLDGVELGGNPSGVGSVSIPDNQNGGLGGTFGTNAFGDAGDFFYTGLMDGVGYFNNALTPQQVLEVMLNDGTRSELTSDSYEVTVLDANGCSATAILEVTEPVALTVSNTKVDIGCNGADNGSIDITVGGGTPTYNYAWSNSATTEDINGLSPGDYTVTVTDDNGCTITLTENISEPTTLSLTTQRTINYNGSDISCAGKADGAVEVIINGGTPSYTISWSNSETTQEITDLAAGIYTVTVTDGSGCSGTSQITLTDPPSMNLTVNTTSNVSCTGGDDGGLSTTVSGGSGTYSYTWSTTSTSDAISDLIAGTYTVTVTDGFGCTVTGSQVVTEPAVLTVSLSLNGTFGSSGVSCPDEADGGINSTTTGGTTGYTYLWNGGQTTPHLDNIGAGVYMLTVTDANDCTVADTLTITAPSDLSFTVNYSDITDCGVTDGAIGVNASGGTGSYEYSIDGTTWQTNYQFNNLSAGTYNVYVRNDVGTCVKGPRTVVIDVPEAPIINSTLLVNPSTGTSTDGSIIVNATSVTGEKLLYQLVGETGWQESSVFSNLDAGVYTIKVRYLTQSCETAITVELVAGGGVVGADQSSDYCSGEINSGQLVETYFIPFPENQVLESLKSFNGDSCGFSVLVQNPVQSYVSIGVIEAGTRIYYDHWEDGYETNLGFPIQSTTEIWGDGDTTNGYAPGYAATDLFSSSDNIILNESIDTTTATRIANIDYDGGDKMASRGNIAVTRLAWATGSSTLLAGATEVYPTALWGKVYKMPVGEDYLVNSLFEYTGFIVMASEDNTIVDIDVDGDGTPESIITLNQGESHLVNGNVNSGANIHATEDVQVHLVTGDECAGFETRWFTLKPVEQWSDAYYSPVSTTGDDTYVHVFNNSGGTITINWETNAGAQTPFTLNNGQTLNRAIPDGSGAKFYSTGGEDFYAISTTTTYSISSAYDWGFALIPEDQLSPQITLVSLAPGIDPTQSGCALNLINQSTWNLHYVSSQETVDEFAPATQAFDGDDNTYWHTEYGTSTPTHPHDLQIDLGASFNVGGFRYKPRVSCTGGASTNTYTETSNVNIPTSSSTVTSQLTIAESGIITDLDIPLLDVKHTWVSDLRITLTSPSGTDVILYNRDCDDNDNINLAFDDEAATGYGCPPTGGGTYQPWGSLSDFDGEDMNGTWTLTIEDFENGDGGFLDEWRLKIESIDCTAGDGAIADYEFYLSQDGINWGTAESIGTFPNSGNEQEVIFPNKIARYVRMVANSEINGNLFASIAELNILECASVENYSPVWLTAGYPTGSTSSGSIEVCVDYNGDGGSLADVNGVTYDTLYLLNELDRIKILDDDGDQTGMRIWVCDGSDALIAGAWGQDPSTAPGGAPAIDLGVGLPNGIPFSTSKCVNLSKDYNLDGDFDECDEVIYTIIVENTGVLPLTTGALSIIDTLPDGLTYISGSLISRTNGTNDTIPDETSTATPFPLDEGGINYSSIIQPGDSIILFFEASIDDLANGTIMKNQAHVKYFQTEFVPEVTFPVDDPVDPELTGVPADITVACDSVPTAPLMDEPNCEITNIEYPAQQTSGTTLMNGEVLSGGSVNATFTLTEGGITEQFRLADNLYPRDGLENIPCGASTKAIDFQIQQEESNREYGSDSSSVFEINFSEPVENLSFSITDLDEGLFFVDAVEVRIFDGANSEIDYDCGFFTKNNNVDWSTDKEFQARDNTDGYTPVADTDSDGDVRFTFYNLAIKRVEITLKNNWNTGSTSTGTTSSVFSAYMSANPGVSHGVGIGQICFCEPGTNEGTIFIANDCAGIDSTSYTEVRTDGTCDSDYSLTRTWTAVDHCGNDTTISQVITVVDDVAPVIAGVPADVTVTPSTIPTPPTTDCSNGVNLAIGKTATQSSTAYSGVASRAIDGNTNGNYNGGNSVTHTNNVYQPWWQVDLGSIDTISVIELYNRTDCCSGRLSQYYVLVSEFPFPSNDLSTLLNDPDVVAYYQSTIAGSPTTINVNSTARYVRVQLTGTNPLSLAEVEIYGSIEDCIKASDRCDSDLTVSFSESTITNACNYTIERVWTATDDCGNIARDTQNIFVGALLSATDSISSDYNGRDISCVGATDGSAFVIPEGGVRPYNYAWAGSTSVDSFATGLSAGTYTVTITDFNGCTSINEITLVDPPAIDLNAQATSGDATYQISCHDGNDGTASAFGTNGTGTITYEWSTGATTSSISGLVAGTYTVTATDGNDCTTSTTVTLAEPPVLSINTSIVEEVSCLDATDGSILATPAGGVTPYTLLWNTNDNTANLSDLGIGTYRLTVTDGNGCTAVDSITLNNPAPIVVDFTIDKQVSCVGGSDGEITASASGGTAGYSYAWNNTDTGASITGLSAGTYIVTVTNSESCTVVDSILLIEPNPLTAILSVTSDFNGFNLSCNGASDARVKVINSGGVAPYTYLWDDTGATTIDSLNGVPAGTYNVTVTDANLCTTTGTIEVFEPSPVVASAGADQYACSNFDVDLGASGTGGTGNYIYLWSTGATTDSITVNTLVDSTFYVTVTDENSCTSVDAIFVNIIPCTEICDNGIDDDFDGLIDCEDPDCFSSAIAFVTSDHNGEDISCVGFSDGEVTVRPTGGKEPYSYVWSDPLGQTDTTAVGLPAGTYTVTITDDNGCTTTASATLEDPSVLALTVDNYSATVSCVGSTDGFIDVSVSGGTTLTGSDYTYVWSIGGITTQDINPPLGVGTYTVTVTDVNNCTATTTATIGNPIPIGAGATIASAYGAGSEGLSCAGATDGMLVASGSGGDGNYDYEWNTGSNNDSLINVGAGTYTVTVSDGFGCSGTAEVTLNNPPPLNLNVSPVAATDCGVLDGSITITASGSTGDLEYSIDNITWQSSNSFTNLSAGTYPVYVRNTDETCVAGPEYVVVAEPAPPIIFSVAEINPQTTTSMDGEILVEAVGESSPLEYRLVGVTPWQTSAYFQGLDDISYTVEVRNQGATCPASMPVLLRAGGGLFGDSGASFCSDDFDNDQISETYFIPIPENEVLNALDTLYSASCGGSTLPTNPVRSYVSIGVVESDAIIYFDHWEDDFETDLGSISQATTEIWGDGILTNGVAPGHPSDLLSAGDVIVLDNNVDTLTRQSVFDFDGGDKIASRGNLSITRLAWAAGPETFLAGAVEMNPTVDWGNTFTIPVGTNVNVNNMFEYVGVSVMAQQDGTSVSIDIDADGTIDITTTLDEGESYFVNGTVQVGATINSSLPVQAHIVTGDICNTYESRFLTIVPREDWGSSYYNPVSSPWLADPDSTFSLNNIPTYVHIFNPNNNTITVQWETSGGIQSPLNIPADSSRWVKMPSGTGAHFYTNSGLEFYPIATIDSEGEGLYHDWGYGLIPESQLTPQITMVGFAPGQDPTYTGGASTNTSPVWITGDYPTGSMGAGSFTICIDYNGDGGPLIDVNGTAYDVDMVLTELGQAKIFDPDGDQTGMRIWVCDNSEAIIAGAWGQDPAVAVGINAIQELDLGTGLPNGIPFNTNECVDLTYDHNNDGLFDVCDEVTYTVSIQNTGALPFPANSILITNTLANELTYSENSTVVYVNGVPTAWSDDATPPSSTTFPFDEGGAYYPNAIQPGDSIEIIFTASINAQPSGDGYINNIVTVFDGVKTTITEVDFYVENQTAPTLIGVPIDVTVSCDTIPDPPAIDTANCTLTEVPYPAAHPIGTTAMNGQNLMAGGVTTTYSILSNDIIEDYRMTDGQYPRSATQSMPCGASSKAISLTQEQMESNVIYGNGDTTVIQIEFSEAVEDLSFGLLDFDEGIYFVDGATVRVFDASNTEINYDCSQLTIGRNITMEGANHFQALDNADGFTPVADTDSIGDVRFNFYDIPVKRVEITLTNDWDSGSTSSGTSATTFGDYFVANPNIDHGIGISEMCYCVPGTIDDAGTIIPEGDCRNDVTITYSETISAATCANDYTITRTWTATDHCGQSTVYTQSIVVEDNDAPTITGVPADVTVTPSTIPTVATVTGSDNCDSAPIITYQVDSIPSGCQYVIQRIWIAEDACTNITRDTQNITVDVALDAITSVTSNFNTQQISCFGEDDGVAIVEVTGDYYPYNYSWSNSDADSILNDVVAGTYTVTVTNSIGCTTTASITISQPTELIITERADTTICPGATVVLTAGASGGNGSYQYVWDNSLGTGDTHAVNPLLTTTYNVTVTDLNNCTAVEQVIITVEPCTEICDDGIDNDLDGDIDCDDTDCVPLATSTTLVTCDNSNLSGQGTFILHDANPIVSSESGVMISYHATLTDAQGGINPLTSPYTSGDGAVYVRVERISSGCFAVAMITLNVDVKCVENCGNGIDDDGDGLIDCDDPDCPCCKAYAPTLNGVSKKEP